MYDIERLPSTIDIGFTGEHKFRTIQIDMTAWMQKIPSGVPSIVFVRPGESASNAYAVITTFENNILTWEITKDDLGGKEGAGVAQVWLELSTPGTFTLDKRGMSTIVTLNIHHSVCTDTPGLPTEQLNWDEQIADKIGSADIANNLVTTEAGKVLDARQGKILNERKIDKPAGMSQGRFLQTDANGLAVWGSPASEATIVEETNGWLEENISNPSSPPLDASLTLANAAARSDVVGQAVKDFNGLFVGDSATFVNRENISSFTESLVHTGFGAPSVSSGVATYATNGASETSPYIVHTIDLGTKKWLVGFKYKVTKVNSSAGNPEKTRIHLGQTGYDVENAFGEWVNFNQVETVDLTRVRFSLYGFSSAPPADAFTVEIKDMYAYDVSAASDDMCNYVISRQNAGYRDGTVKYDVYKPDKTLETAGKAADAKAVTDAIREYLVYNGSSGETATLTNKLNAYSFESNATKSGFSDSYSDGVATYTANGGNSETSPYAMDSGAWGSKKWIVGFKYKLTKLNSQLGDPECIRIHLGASTYFDSLVSWGEWVTFEKTLTVDLTRVRISARVFSSVPPSGSFKLEIKEVYLYDATDVSDKMCSLIMERQRDGYQDGTVVYEEFPTGYFPDMTLTKRGIAAESKAVGDALNSFKIDVTRHGVKGDGVTDDTNAINRLFNSRRGIFYFPAGTYKITGTIELPANSSMCGDGESTIINMTSCDNLTACTFRGQEKIYPYILARNNNISVHDIKLVGNYTLHQQRHGGICIVDAERCSVHDCRVFNINFDPNQDLVATVSGYGICAVRSSFCHVERCIVERCGYECIGIADECNFCTVRDCHTKNGWRCCIQVHRGACNTLIENCYMEEDHPKYDACFAIHGLPAQLCDNITMNNCVMVCKQNGAHPYQYVAPAQIMGDTRYLRFTNNRVFGGYRAFYIGENHTNATIIGNEFNCNDTSDYGVLIASYNTIVIGNYLHNDAGTENIIRNNPLMVGNIGIS